MPGRPAGHEDLGYTNRRMRFGTMKCSGPGARAKLLLKMRGAPLTVSASLPKPAHGARSHYFFSRS